MPESLAQLVSPFVRLELLLSGLGSPLAETDRAETEEGRSLSGSMKWHHVLESFEKSHKAAAGGKEDVDGALLPTLVEKVLLPKVKFQVLHGWDATVLGESSRIWDLVCGVWGGLDSGEGAQDLLLTVKNKLHGELDRASVPLWPRKCR